MRKLSGYLEDQFEQNGARLWSCEGADAANKRTESHEALWTIPERETGVGRELGKQAQLHPTTSPH